jgi:hypothetical protein
MTIDRADEIEAELARWREWPGPRDEPEGAGEPWARDEDRGGGES